MMTCLTVGASSLTRLPGGLSYNVMQLRNGTYMIVLNAYVIDRDTKEKSVERHCVTMLSEMSLPAYPNYVGALIDNDKRIGVRMLQEQDRTSRTFWARSQKKASSPSGLVGRSRQAEEVWRRCATRQTSFMVRASC